MTDDLPTPSDRLLGMMREWWDPPAHLISTLPKGGVALQYLGHADTTRAIIETDPEWTLEPMSYDDRGQPVLTLDDQGRPVGLWCWLTICGVRRPCYGSCLPGKGEAIKELLGDAIRNGAMRFGIAGGLWSKAERPAEEKASVPDKGRDQEPTKSAGKIIYEELCLTHGEQAVKGALATHDIKRFTDLTPELTELVRSTLTAKAAAVQMMQEAFAATAE